MPAAPPIPIIRTSYASGDPLEAREFVERDYGARLQVAFPRERDWQITLDQVQAGQITSGRLSMPADLASRVTGQDEFVITTMIDGAVELAPGPGAQRFRRGDVLAASPEQPAGDWRLLSNGSAPPAGDADGRSRGCSTACSPILRLRSDEGWAPGSARGSAADLRREFS